MRATTVTALALLLAVGGCRSTRPLDAPAPGAQLAFDGRVASVDTAPWAYDGNAVVVVTRDAGGDVRVQLPARWNLCPAPPVDATSLKAGDRVHVVASAGEAGSATVCERAGHRLQRIGG